MTTATQPRRDDLRHIALEAIDVREGFNPRQDVDEELVDSIRAKGVLQALVVTPNGEQGRYELIAGERRLRAARAAGLKEVPALIRENPGEGEDFEIAVIENVKRKDLTPIEEAKAFDRAKRERGMNQKAIAAAFNVSAAIVRDRLRLLALPEDVQGHVASGVLSHGAVAELTQIAKVSPPIASRLSAAIADDGEQLDSYEFTRDPSWAVDAYAAGTAVEEGDPEQLAVAVGGWHTVPGLPLPEGSEELLARAEALAGARGGGQVGLRFDESVIDAARAYGCLLEFDDGGFYNRSFITDRGFLADQVKQAIEAAEKDAAAAQEADAKSGGDPDEATGAPDSGGAEEQAREERRKEREAAERLRVKMRGANLDLGAELAQRYAKAEPSAEVVDLLVGLLLSELGGSFAARGMRYVVADWQTEEVIEQKNGRTRSKITYLEPAEAKQHLEDWLAAAKTPKQKLGRLVQALIAARYASEEVVAQSNRAYFSLPGLDTGWINAGAPTPAAEALAALAEPVLPKPLAPRKRSKAS